MVEESIQVSPVTTTFHFLRMGSVRNRLCVCVRDKYFGCLPCLSCTICLRIHERSPRRQKQRRADVPDTSVDSRQSLFSRVFGVGVALSRSSMNRLVAAVRRGISACAQICSRAASSAKVSFLAGAKYMQTRCGDWFPHERRRHVPTRTRGHAAQGRGKQVTRARVACTMPRGAALARVAAARRTQRETVCSRHGRIGAAVPVRVASWRAVRRHRAQWIWLVRDRGCVANALRAVARAMKATAVLADAMAFFFRNCGDALGMSRVSAGLGLWSRKCPNKLAFQLRSPFRRLCCRSLLALFFGVCLLASASREPPSVCAIARAYIATYCLSRFVPGSHGPRCRSSTAFVSSAITACMASSLHGALLFTTVLICPGFCLWWPPKANPEREAWIHQIRQWYGEQDQNRKVWDRFQRTFLQDLVARSSQCKNKKCQDTKKCIHSMQSLCTSMGTTATIARGTFAVQCTELKPMINPLLLTWNEEDRILRGDPEREVWIHQIREWYRQHRSSFPQTRFPNGHSIWVRFQETYLQDLVARSSQCKKCNNTEKCLHSRESLCMTMGTTATIACKGTFAEQCKELEPMICPLLLKLNRSTKTNDWNEEQQKDANRQTTEDAFSTLPVAQSASSGSTTICGSASRADEGGALASTPLGSVEPRAKKPQDLSSLRSIYATRDTDCKAEAMLHAWRSFTSCCRRIAPSATHDS